MSQCICRRTWKSHGRSTSHPYSLSSRWSNVSTVSDVVTVSSTSSPSACTFSLIESVPERRDHVPRGPLVQSDLLPVVVVHKSRRFDVDLVFSHYRDDVPQPLLGQHRRQLLAARRRRDAHDLDAVIILHRRSLVVEAQVQHVQQ